jgi:Protein of unknown function (DUF3810)
MRWRIALVALAAAAAWLPTPSGLVERFYSLRAYALWQRPMTALSNSAPFALLDVLIVLVIGAWLALAARDLVGKRRPGALRAAARIVVRTVVWSASLYVIFLLVWGLNYRRTPLLEKLAFDARAVTPDAARALALTTVEQLNALHEGAHAAGWPADGAVDSALAASLARADREVGGRGVVTVGRPKPTLLDWYFRRAAVDGMTDPYFLETLVSATLLPFERPFIVAHEWSHLAGVADEGDANFLAWLTCVQAPPPAQYSGWLFLYAEVAGALRGPARVEVADRLGPGPRADLAAIRARLVRQVDRRVLAVGQRVYDRYLKANRVEAGVESYGHVVQLVLGARFGPGWVPETR